MAKFIHEVLSSAAAAKTAKEKVKILQDNPSQALKDVLMGTFDDRVQWALPVGSPPYNPCRPESMPKNLLRANTQFKYFVKSGPAKDLVQYKRERIFIGLLESIHPKDALVVINMVNKKAPEGITAKIASDAFPGLIKEKVKN